MVDGPADELRGAVDRAARGDESAWRTIIERCGPRVFALLRSRCGDADLAEEIAQSVFVTVAEKLPTMADRTGFESWLFTIALNRLRDEVRRRARHARPSGDLEALGGASGDPVFKAPPMATTDSDSRLKDLVGDLERAMQELSAADREIIDLRHVGGLSFQQMAELLGEPIGTLLSRHHRAIARLRTFMERARK
jgi:RNA polymerase sigma-70 factor (ECF subfamily)